MAADDKKDEKPYLGIDGPSPFTLQKMAEGFVCPICGFWDYTPVIAHTREGGERKTALLKCGKCSVVFQDPKYFTTKRRH